ncbi:hypothetical protein [Pseudomonas sp. ICMP 561]|uniref:hypothetical protein n=1 Tax=Pseudomonas sp. ICMP 561 TaxID=1718918 RepID=UPI000C06E461|nr:hypothetical protein [Pseudomonas sp. ICMP 561]PHN17218.1 hypothetical protein AO242_21235 [Pseudomonas sp. ICMP 561]
MSPTTEILKAIVVALLGGWFGAWITSIRAKWTAFSSDYSKRLEQGFVLIDQLSECSCLWWERIDPSDKLKVNPGYIAGLQSRLTTFIQSMDDDYSGFNTSGVDQAYHDFTDECTGGLFPEKDAVVASGKSAAILNNAERLKAQLFAVRRRDYSMRLNIKKSRAR